MAGVACGVPNWRDSGCCPEPQLRMLATRQASRYAMHAIIAEAIRQVYDTVPGRGRGLCVIDRLPS